METAAHARSLMSMTLGDEDDDGQPNESDVTANSQPSSTFLEERRKQAKCHEAESAQLISGRAQAKVTAAPTAPSKSKASTAVSQKIA